MPYRRKYPKYGKSAAKKKRYSKRNYRRKRNVNRVQSIYRKYRTAAKIEMGVRRYPQRGIYKFIYNNKTSMAAQPTPKFFTRIFHCNNPYDPDYDYLSGNSAAGYQEVGKHYNYWKAIASKLTVRARVPPSTNNDTTVGMTMPPCVVRLAIVRSDFPPSSIQSYRMDDMIERGLVKYTTFSTAKGMSRPVTQVWNKRSLSYLPSNFTYGYKTSTPDPQFYWVVCDVVSPEGAFGITVDLDVTMEYDVEFRGLKLASGMFDTSDKIQTEINTVQGDKHADALLARAPGAKGINPDDDDVVELPQQG